MGLVGLVSFDDFLPPHPWELFRNMSVPSGWLKLCCRTIYGIIIQA